MANALSVISQRFNEQDLAPKYTGFTFKGVTSNGIKSSLSHWSTVTEIASGLSHLKNAFKSPSIKQVICNINGLVKPGELLLVPGRLGAGCSSFLKSLSGENDGFTSVVGEVKYDTASSDDMQKHFRKKSNLYLRV